jgi:uncharacterized protein (TIGR04551 family)
MPNQWGLGMLANSGDCLDCDYQSNSDRIMFVTGLKSIDLYFGGMWDFVASGPTTASPYDVYGGQPYNRANLANVDQWGAFIARRTNPELQRLKLARGDLVLNGGLFTVWRKQHLDVKAGQNPITGIDNVTPTPGNGLERRGAEVLIPDFWVQILWNKLRLEAEFAAIYGSIENSPVSAKINDPLQIRMFGLSTQAEFRAVEDKLRIQFSSGWASGDPNVEASRPGRTASSRAGAKVRSRRSASTRRTTSTTSSSAASSRACRARTTSARASNTTSSATRAARSSAAARRSSGAARASSSRRRATVAISASSSTSRSTTRQKTAR